jgi:hypothetical protein
LISSRAAVQRRKVIFAAVEQAATGKQNTIGKSASHHDNPMSAHATTSPPPAILITFQAGHYAQTASSAHGFAVT